MEVIFKNDIDEEDIGEFDESLSEITEYVDGADSSC